MNERQFKAPQTSNIANESIRKVIIYGLSLLAMVGGSLFVYQANQQQVQQEQILMQAKEENAEATAKNRELFQATQQLKDPQYLEQVARRDYYYTKPGETVFELGSSVDKGE